MWFSLQNQYRIYICCFIFILILECILAWLWSAKWVSLTSGFLGSLALTIPPARIELIKQNADQLKELKISGDLDNIRNSIMVELDRKISGWNVGDSLFIFFGAALMCGSFFISILEEALTSQ